LTACSLLVLGYFCCAVILSEILHVSMHTRRCYDTLCSCVIGWLVTQKYCVEMARWIKLQLGAVVGLGLCEIVLYTS